MAKGGWKSVNGGLGEEQMRAIAKYWKMLVVGKFKPEILMVLPLAVLKGGQP